MFWGLGGSRCSTLIYRNVADKLQYKHVNAISVSIVNMHEHV